MAVTGYVGYPGGGKTYTLVEVGLRARKRGALVYANFRLGGLIPFCDCEKPGAGRHSSGCVGRIYVPFDDVTVIESWEQLMALRAPRDRYGAPNREVVVLLDELNLWAPSRFWQALPAGLLSTWAYVRKNGLDVHWSSQSERRVDTLVREVTNEVVACRKVGGRGARAPLGFVRTRWLPGDSEGSEFTKARGRKRLGWAFTRFRLSVAQAFDTYEQVPTPKHLERVGVGRK